MISKCEYAMSGVVSHKGLLPRLSYLQGYKPTPFLGQSQRNCPSSFYTIYQSPFLSLASPPISAECLYHNLSGKERDDREKKQWRMNGRGLAYAVEYRVVSVCRSSGMEQHKVKTLFVRHCLPVSCMERMVVVRANSDTSYFSLYLR